MTHPGSKWTIFDNSQAITCSCSNLAIHYSVPQTIGLSYLTNRQVSLLSQAPQSQSVVLFIGKLNQKFFYKILEGSSYQRWFAFSYQWQPHLNCKDVYLSCPFLYRPRLITLTHPTPFHPPTFTSAPLRCVTTIKVFKSFVKKKRAQILLRFSTKQTRSVKIASGIFI